jgi:hypothetical protein
MKKHTRISRIRSPLFALLGAVSAVAVAGGCVAGGDEQKTPFSPKLGDGGYYYYPPDSGYYYPDSDYYYPPDSGYYYPDSGYYYPPDSGYYYPDSGYYYPPDSGYYYPPDGGYYYPPDGGYYYPDAGIIDAGGGDAQFCTSDGGCDECDFPGTIGEGPSSDSVMMSYALGSQGSDDGMTASSDNWCSEWNITHSQSISGSVGINFEIVGIGFSSKVNASWTGSRREGYKLCSDEGPPCVTENGTRRVARESTMTCFRECKKQISGSVSGQLSLFGSGGSTATTEELTQSNNVTSTITVPAGTPVSNLSGMCTNQLNSLAGSSFGELCDATDQDFEANLEWRYTGTDCGAAADPDAWCEAQDTLPSVDAWTVARCKVGGGPAANTYYTFCKLYSVPQGACPGECSTGMFEYPCAAGLVCVRAPDSDVNCGCGLFQSACKYHCIDDGSGTYTGPGPGGG